MIKINEIPKNENEENEFKEDFNNLTKEPIKNTIKAFLNNKGGKLFIGISDSGELTGVDSNKFDKVSQWISHIFESYSNLIKLTLEKKDSFFYFLINVLPSNNILYENDGKVYVRKQATLKKISGKELEEYIKNRSYNKKYIEKILKENFDFNFPINFIYEDVYLEQSVLDNFDNLMKKLLEIKHKTLLLWEKTMTLLYNTKEIIYSDNNYEIRFHVKQPLLNPDENSYEKIIYFYFETFVIFFDKYFNFEKISTEINNSMKKNDYEKTNYIFKNQELTKAILAKDYDSYNSIDKKELYERVKSFHNLIKFR